MCKDDRIMYQCLPVSRVGMEGMIIFLRNLEKASYRLVTGVVQAMLAAKAPALFAPFILY